MFSDFFPGVLGRGEWARCVNGGRNWWVEANRDAEGTWLLVLLRGLLRLLLAKPPRKGCAVCVLLRLWPGLPREPVELVPVSS